MAVLERAVAGRVAFTGQNGVDTAYLASEHVSTKDGSCHGIERGRSPPCPEGTVSAQQVGHIHQIRAQAALSSFPAPLAHAGAQSQQPLPR